jgi:pyruvate dehydrogenase (quinone)
MPHTSHAGQPAPIRTDFPYRPFLPDDVPVIQVDVRGGQIAKRVPVRVPLAGTVKDTIEALLPRVTPKADTAHLDRMTRHYRRARARLDDLAKPGRDGAPPHPRYFLFYPERSVASHAGHPVNATATSAMIQELTLPYRMLEFR